MNETEVDTVVVQEVTEAVIEVVSGDLFFRSFTDKGDEMGDILSVLSNGRRLVFLSNGVFDADDLDENLQYPNGVCPASINWEELLQLLDGWREKRRVGEMN